MGSTLKHAPEYPTTVLCAHICKFDLLFFLHLKKELIGLNNFTQEAK